MVGSKIIFTVPIENVNAFTGSLYVRIGNTECGVTPAPSECFACRKYVGIVVSEAEIDPVDATTFEDVWIPIGDSSCKCDNGNPDPKDSTIENLNVRINNLRQDNINRTDANAADIVANKALYDAYVGSNDAAVALVQSNLDDYETSNDAALAAVVSDVADLDTKSDDYETRITAVEDNFASADIMTKIDADLDTKLDGYKTASIDPTLTSLQNQIDALDARVTVLEP